MKNSKNLDSVNPNFNLFPPFSKTLSFIYNGTNLVMDSLSSSKITQTATAITSEVRRTAGYACTCADAGTSTIYTAIVDTNISELAVSDIVQTGVTLAVTFANARTTNSTGLSLQVKIKDTTLVSGSAPIYVNNAVISANNKFGWVKGATVYFTYRDGKWHVVDNGSYSKIE